MYGFDKKLPKHKKKRGKINERSIHRFARTYWKK